MKDSGAQKFSRFFSTERKNIFKQGIRQMHPWENMDVDLPAIFQASAAALVLMFIALAFIYPYLGGTSATQVSIGQYIRHDCEARLATLSQEYGDSAAQDSFFVNGNDISIVKFNSSWTVPINGQDCRIIEDDRLGKESFQLERFRTNLRRFNGDFFSATRDCLNVKSAKGASDVCELTGMGKQIMDFPVTQIAISLPTQDSQSFAKALGGKGWADLTGKGVKLAKKADGVSIYLDLSNEASCSLGNTPKKAIWDLADNGNQMFSKAKEGQFDTDTIPKLTATSNLIMDFEGLKVEFTMPAREQPKDALGSLAYAGQVTADAIVYSANTLTQAAYDTITIVGTPQCTPESQVAKFQDFKNMLTSQDFIGDYSAFSSTLTAYKSEANSAIAKEKESKDRNAPSLTQYLLISKALQYNLLEGSQSQQLFNDQRYVSAKQTAENQAVHYDNYWKQTSIADYALSAVIWIVLLAVVVVVGIAIAVMAYRLIKN